MKEKIRRKKIKNLKSLEEIPEFKSEEEESEFWDTHSAADLIEKGLLEEVKLEITGPLRKKLEEHRKKRLISLRLNPEQVEKAKEIAIQKGMGYLTLMRNWIQEGIERELGQKDDFRPIIEILDRLSGFQDPINRIARLIDNLENFTNYMIHDITRSNVYYPLGRGKFSSIPLPRRSKSPTNPFDSMIKRDNPLIIQ